MRATSFSFYERSSLAVHRALLKYTLIYTPVRAANGTEYILTRTSTRRDSAMFAQSARLPNDVVLFIRFSFSEFASAAYLRRPSALSYIHVSRARPYFQLYIRKYTSRLHKSCIYVHLRFLFGVPSGGSLARYKCATRGDLHSMGDSLATLFSR